MNVSGALNFILINLFDVYIMIVFTRFLLQLLRADFYNPVSQFVVKATTPILKPLRRIILQILPAVIRDLVPPAAKPI